MSALMVRKTNAMGTCEWPKCVHRGQVQVLLLGRNLETDSHDGQFKLCQPHAREWERVFARKGLEAAA